MIEIKPFGVGLGVIGLQLNKPVTAEIMRAYWLAFRDETDAREWETFAAGAARRFGWTFLPIVPELLDALREFRGAPALQPEAVAAYERVLACGEYCAEGGTTWAFRRVLEHCGIAAAEAFQTAGGHSAFATTWDETRRRERFVAAYQLAARQDPQTRALPAAPGGLALEGEVETPTPGPVDAGAATQAMREILERIGVKVGPLVVKAPVVIATAERLAELRRQAEQLNDVAPVAEEV